jgi:hypothetical protein
MTFTIRRRARVRSVDRFDGTCRVLIRGPRRFRTDQREKAEYEQEHGGLRASETDQNAVLARPKSTAQGAR